MKSSLSLSLAALAGLATTSDATTPVATSLMHSIHQASDQYADLGDLVPTTKSVGWDGYWTDRSWYQAGFIINSETFATGVFAHAPSLALSDSRTVTPLSYARTASTGRSSATETLRRQAPERCHLQRRRLELSNCVS